MRCIYYCTTPLQVMNALNLHINNTLYTEDDYIAADIAVVNKFRDAVDICEKLKTEKIFDNVYLVNEEDRQNQRNGVLKAMGIAWDVIFPLRLLRQQYGRQIVSRIRNNYDIVVSSFFSHSVAALLSINHNATYVMMDDGMATYFGNWTNRLRSKSYLSLLKLVNNGKAVSQPEVLYVFRPEMCESDMTDNIRMLPGLSEQFLQIAKRIFGRKADTLNYSEPVVWLSHVSNNEDKLLGSKKIAKILSPYRDYIIVRIHPRELKKELYTDYEIDDVGTMWEIQLCCMDLNNKLFITLGSTGAFTPKFLYNKEPWLLFAYNLIKLPNGVQQNDFNRMVDKLKSIYKHPEHICVPQTWEEFDGFVHEFLGSLSYDKRFIGTEDQL